MHDLLRWNGTIDRAPFVKWGLSLMVLKYILDQLISQLFFHRSWSIFEYFAPAAAAYRLESDAVFFLTILAASLPFAYIGCALTVRRLRSANLPLWLVLFFFLPVINLIFFKIICWMPSVVEQHPMLLQSAAASQIANSQDYEHLREADYPVSEKLLFARFIPRTKYWSLVASIAYPALIGLATGFLAMETLGAYGWGVFVALPFVLSTLSVLIYSYWQPRLWLQCLQVAWAELLFMGLVLLLLGHEGAICLIMATPLTLGIGLVGAFLGFHIQPHRPDQPGPLPQLPAMFIGLSLLLPASIYLEAASAKDLPVYKVSSTLDVAAPPAVVWQNVVAFSQLPEPSQRPQDWLFNLGVAYPKCARITGSGPGAIRHCVFSTGTFVEPIAVWDEPRRLAFNVTSQALPMRELSPYNGLHPRHLDGYLKSQHGEFYLATLPSGGTRLTGTTWYTNDMGPQPYWRIWSDGIIHSIHFRVLEHVRHLSENKSET